MISEIVNDDSGNDDYVETDAAIDLYYSRCFEPRLDISLEI
jgi:hypothetical protein